jgi:hypothetical protein
MGEQSDNLWRHADFLKLWAGQTVTPDHLLGRVNATSRIVSTGALTIGSLAGGTLGAVLGLRPTLVIGAVGGLVAVVRVICSPVRALRERSIEERANAAS